MLVNVFASAAIHMLRDPGGSIQKAADGLDKITRRVAEAHLSGRRTITLPAGAVDVVSGVCLAIGPATAEAHARTDAISELLKARASADDMRSAEIHVRAHEAEALIQTAVEILETASPSNATVAGVKKRLAAVTAA